MAPNSEQIITNRKLDGNLGGYLSCNGWQGGDPRLPGWKLSIRYNGNPLSYSLTTLTGPSLKLASGPGRVYFSTDIGTEAGLSCPLDGYTFVKFAEEAEFPCLWSLN